MRKLLFCGILCAASSFVFGQAKINFNRFKTRPPKQALIGRYWANYLLIESTYNCTSSGGKSSKMVNNATFDTLMKPIFSNVFVGSNDLSQNTTAASFSQNTDKGTLSLNYAHKIRRGTVMNIGAFSKATDGVFGIYTSNSWSSDVGINIGFSFAFRASQYFKPSDCNDLQQQRKTAMVELIKSYKEVTKYNIKRLKKRRDNIQQQINGIPVININSDTKDYVKLTDRLNQLDSVIKLYNSIVTDVDSKPNEPQLMEKLLNGAITKLELKKKKAFTGYKVWWIGTNVALSNNALSLNTDSLPATLKKSYVAKNLGKFLFSINLNRQRNTEGCLEFASIGVDFGVHNYLDHPVVKKPGLRYPSTSNVYEVWNKNESYFSNYSDLTADIKTFEPNLNYTLFLTAKKQFGFNLRFDSRIPFKLPNNISYQTYPSYFNLAIGPVFRLNSSEAISKGTVGLDVGWMNCVYKTHVWDAFGFKFKVGVPFNSLIK